MAARVSSSKPNSSRNSALFAGLARGKGLAKSLRAAELAIVETLQCADGRGGKIGSGNPVERTLGEIADGRAWKRRGRGIRIEGDKRNNRRNAILVGYHRRERILGRGVRARQDQRSQQDKVTKSHPSSRVFAVGIGAAVTPLANSNRMVQPRSPTGSAATVCHREFLGCQRVAAAAQADILQFGDHADGNRLHSHERLAEQIGRHRFR